MKKRVVLILCLVLALSGVGVLAYPTASNWLAVQAAAADIRSYMQACAQISAEEKEQKLLAAQAYNASLTGIGVADPYTRSGGAVATYSQLDGVGMLEVEDMVAYIEIPVIEVALPVRHGTNDEVLDECVGSLEATSLPTGGLGNHAVLTAHRSQPGARLFADLDQMEVGNRFYIVVLGQIHCYEVYDITVIRPEDTSLLMPVENRDLTTLVTCEPYASEEFRLLVRGERVLPDPVATGTSDYALPLEADTYTPLVRSIVQTGDKGLYIWLAVGGAALAALAILLAVRHKKRKK